MTKPKPAARPELVWVNPETLTPDPTNPRQITDANRDRLRSQLEHFGIVETLVVNRRTGQLVSGHQRRALAVELGLPEVPVFVVDLPPAEADALAVALNSPDVQGVWDLEALAVRLDQLAVADLADLAGFAPETLEAFALPSAGEPERVSFTAQRRGRDTIPNHVPDDPETQPGDVWELGDHRVVCADAFTFDVRRFNGGPVAMILTDPPYAIFGSSTGVGADVTDDRIVRPFFESLARAAVAATDPQAHILAHCDWRSWAAIWEGFRRGGLAIRNMVVWDKGGGLGSNYVNAHELVVFAHNTPRASNTFDNRRPAGYRPVYTANVIRVGRPQGDDRLHHAAKPVPLLVQLIENSSDPGAVVLDLFAGSGSTLIAADNVGRAAIAVDVDPGWCDVIVERWRRHSGKRGRLRRGAALDFISAPPEHPADDAEDSPAPVG